MIRRRQQMTSGISLLAIAVLCGGCSKEEVAPASTPEPAVDQPLIVYSAMPASRLAPVLQAYTAETGKKVQLVVNEEDISGTFSNGGESLPAADLHIAQSFGELWGVAEMDGYRPTFSDSIESNTPAALRDPESRWVALAKRVRIVFYNKGQLSAEEMEHVLDYASLGKKIWQGKLCLSSSQVAGNRTLIAHLIDKYGVRSAEITVRQWRANLAVSPFPDDAALVRAVADGQCKIGIADLNILLEHAAANPDTSLVHYLFSTSVETLVDVSGAGVSRHAHDPDGAVQLLEWLMSAPPNALFAALGKQIPINPNAPRGNAVADWAEHISSPESLSNLGYLLEEADRLIERARFP